MPRPTEPFHRMYSPPEAPGSRVRRPVVVGAIGAVLVTAAAATTVVVVAGPDTPVTDRAPLQAMARASSGPAVAAQATLSSVPTACAVLSPDAVRRLVPTATPNIDRMGTDVTSVCRYSQRHGGRYRSVLVDSRAFLPKYLHEAATAMTVWSFGAQWSQAKKDLTPGATLRRVGGLGDAAFERYWIDRDARVAVGEVTVRFRNVLLRMQYSEERPEDRAAGERRCLAAAVSAARTGLAAYGG